MGEGFQQAQVRTLVIGQIGQPGAHIEIGQRGQLAQGVGQRSQARCAGGRLVQRLERLVAGPPLEQGRIENLGLHRLGDEIVHARRQAALPVFGKGIGGHGDDRQILPLRQLPNLPRRRDAVHARHLHVHQHDVEILAGDLGAGFQAIHRRLHLHPGVTQQFKADFEIDRLIIDEQDAQRLAGLGQFLRHLVHVGCRHGRLGVLGAALENAGEPEGAALARFAFDAHFTAHQGGQALGDGQPQAGAAELAGGRAVGLDEGFEQLVAGLGRQADAGIAHRKAQGQLLIGAIQHIHAQADRAGGREFDGVAGEIEQGLAHPGFIALDPQRAIGTAEFQRQPLFLGALGDDRAHLVEQDIERKIALFQIQPAGLDFGQVQDVVDDGEEMLGRGVDFPEMLEVAGGAGRIAAEQESQPEDGVHRGPDLVAHVGQEGALCLAGAFGLLLGQ